jgi:hypothetical protein
MLFEKIFAALVLLICVLALWRGALGVQRRQQWDARLQRALGSSRHAGHRLAQRWQAWRSQRQATQAAQQAHAAIERARRAAGPSEKGTSRPNENGVGNGGGKGKQNVIYPAAFDPKKRRDDKLH